MNDDLDNLMLAILKTFPYTHQIENLKIYENKIDFIWKSLEISINTDFKVLKLNTIDFHEIKDTTPICTLLEVFLEKNALN